MWARNALFVLVLAAVTPAAQAACPDFAAANKFPSGGSGAISIAAADFNDDALLDVAVLNATTRTVALLKGNGDGTFVLQPARYAVGADTSTLIAKDFNGDQRIDLAIPSYTANSITVLISRGDGTMNASTIDHPFPGNGAAGDFNGDGNNDLVITRLNQTVWFQEGRGDGTFNAPVQSPSSVRGGRTAVADLNGDGKLDLVVLPGADVVRALLGAGDGTFTNASATYPTGGTGAHAISVGDFDRDGKVDVGVVHQSSGDLSVLLGSGDGVFGGPMKYPSGSYPWTVLVHDFTRDGRLDIAVPNEFSDDVSLFVGNGNGTFAPPIRYASSTLPLVAAAGDFNGDGKSDLAVVNYNSNNVSILLSVDTCTTRRRAVRR
jgi:hypothetical protein